MAQTSPLRNWYKKRGRWCKRIKAPSESWQNLMEKHYHNYDESEEPEEPYTPIKGLRRGLREWLGNHTLKTHS